MVKIKVCGLTVLEDALLAAQLGTWAAGFIFTRNSPRYIEPDDAAEIISYLPDNVEKVGVFVDSSQEEIGNIALKARLTQIQLHGSESASFCSELSNSLNLPIIKAIKVKDSGNLSVISEYQEIVSAILLDTHSDKVAGGTGKTFDWNIAIEAKKYKIPIILAGGLNSDNLAEAYLTVKPFALDISSGIELKKGLKEHNRLRELFLEAKKLKL